jgi:hypothetical protein
MDAKGRCVVVHGNPVIDHSKERQGDHSRFLAGPLHSIGVGANSTTIWYPAQGHTAAVCAEANIADWMTYLPETCVRAMVNNGSHWST